MHRILAPGYHAHVIYRGYGRRYGCRRCVRAAGKICVGKESTIHRAINLTHYALLPPTRYTSFSLRISLVSPTSDQAFQLRPSFHFYTLPSSSPCSLLATTAGRPVVQTCTTIHQARRRPSRRSRNPRLPCSSLLPVIARSRRWTLLCSVPADDVQIAFHEL